MARRQTKIVTTEGRDGSERPQLSYDFLIVGIGASAGGIQALSTFFENVPADSGMAFVVILHLSPDHDSQLAHVIQQVTPITVEQVAERTQIKPNHVYVISPDRSLSIEDGHLAVKKIKTVEERRAPVDIFFRTLAEAAGPNAVGVILSGTGANGSMGLKRIKEFGGATFAQNPRESEFSEMPRNAIATELIDDILPVAEIPAKILAYRNSRAAVTIPDEPYDQAASKQAALRDIFMQVRIRTGHDFSNYKRPTMLRRIERRIGIRNLPDIEAYAAFLHEHPDEIRFLLKDLLISVTNFFRDQRAFDTLERKVLPKLLNKRDPNRPIRIWVAGCATGEEAYSLAIICAERTMDDISAPSVQIFATDLDEEAIAIARDGVYTINDAADVSPERLKRFFARDGDRYRIRRELREKILFAQHNIIKDPPFSHLDLVTCRNLLIYLNPSAQERVLETIHFALEPGGFLFLGSSESVDGMGDAFVSFDKASHVYQARRVRPLQLPLPASFPVYNAPMLVRAGGAGGPLAGSGLELISYNDLHLKLLEEFAPPSIVVDLDYNIVHVSERAGRFLQVAAGEPTNNLLRLVLPEIRLELRGALFQAVQQKTNVESRGLQIKIGDKVETVDLLIRPVLGDEKAARGHIVVAFQPANGAENGEAASSEYASPEPVAQQLEEELLRSRGQLRTALEQAELQAEELRASNEELQAMNEELRSSSEELETSKEELQSINEELTTVNQELKVKIDELSQTNNNFENLINSIDIGVIFLDRSLRVNLFSPAASRIFNLIAGDVGRPLSDITNRLVYTDLAQDADLVLDNLQTVERSLNTTDGHAFVMRVFPYRTDDHRINGVILTFVDDTDRRRSERALKATNDLISAQKEAFQAAMSGRGLADSLAPLARAAIAHFDGNAQAAFYAVTNDGDAPALQHVIGMPKAYAAEIKDLAAGPESHSYGQAETTGEPVITVDVNSDPDWKPWRQLAEKHGYRANWTFPVRITGGSTLGTFALYFSQPRSPEENELEYAAVISHAAAVIITRHKDTAELTRNERELVFRGQLLNTVEQSVVATDLDGHVTYWNKFAESMFGWSESEALGRNVLDLNVPDSMIEVGRTIMEQLQRGETWSGEFTLRRRDGSTFPAEVFDTPIMDESGRMIGIVGVSIDITQRKRTQAALAASEERLRILMESFTDIAIFTTDEEGIVTAWNPGSEKIFGYTEEEMIGKKSADIIFTPEDRERGEARRERRVALRDGKALDERWHIRKNGERFFASGFMVALSDGEKHIGFGKIAQDLTQRTRGEQAIRERAMLKRLVEAQEEERQRIARDLHDTLGQQLTALRLKLESFKNIDLAPTAMVRALEGLQAQAKKIDDDLSFLAWELRPTALDNLGLRTALGSYLEEWSKNHNIAAEFHAPKKQSARLTPEIEINLYRIAQEALNNVLKHAKAKKVNVLLEFSGKTVVLVVEDDGVGFNLKSKRRQTRSGGGLGIMGMKERTALLGGTLEIESTRGKGTAVIARVPSRLIK